MATGQPAPNVPVAKRDWRIRRECVGSVRDCGKSRPNQTGVCRVQHHRSNGLWTESGRNFRHGWPGQRSGKTVRSRQRPPGNRELLPRPQRLPRRDEPDDRQTVPERYDRTAGRWRSSSPPVPPMTVPEPEGCPCRSGLQSRMVNRTTDSVAAGRWRVTCRKGWPDASRAGQPQENSGQRLFRGVGCTQ